MNDETLLFDIETNSVDGKIDAATDEFRFFGAYSYKDNRYYSTQKLDEAQKIINRHKVLIGFNNKAFDIPILKRYGINFEYKIIIDIMQVLKSKMDGGKGRNGIIIKDGKNMSETLDSYSLDNVSKWLGINLGKIDDFDYNIFKKTSFTKEEKKHINNYLLRDLQVTKFVWDWLEKYFEPTKKFLSEKDQFKFEYVRSTTAVYAYKVICNYTGMKEEYSNGEKQKFKGAYVADPTGEEFTGDIYCLDYSSLYIHIFIQCNLFSPVESNGYFGDGEWIMQGRYNNKKQGKIELTFQDLYNQRVELKKLKDPSEFGIKIFLSSAYGAVANPAFKNIHSYVAAEDCTQLGQQWIKYAIKTFVDNGYEFIYSDTDSVYIKDVFNDKSKMLSIKDDIINKIKSSVSFPSESFGMKIDDEIKYIKFFKGKKDRYNKKTYLYVTQNNELKIKGLQIIKSSCSNISKYIFDNYIRDFIVDNLKCDFSKPKIEVLLRELFNGDKTLFCTRFKVKEKNFYDTDTSIQYQISDKYGGGVHMLIKNKLFGVGKNVKYCKIEDYDLNFKDLNLQSIWSELNYFVGDSQTNKSWF